MEKIKALHNALDKAFDKFCEEEEDDPEGMTVEEKQLAVIDFMVNRLERLNLSRAEIMRGGRFAEIKLAYETKSTVNTKMQGIDMINKETGKAIESKSTTAKLGDKANVSIEPPAKLRNESVADYKVRISDTIIKKGNMHITHTYRLKDSDPWKENKYVFEAQFIAYLVVSKSGSTGKKVNIGGVGCKTCTRVHRLDVYFMLQELYAFDPEAVDPKLFEIDVPSQCSGNEKNFSRTEWFKTATSRNKLKGQAL
jgi:hypothetical protein